MTEPHAAEFAGASPHADPAQWDRRVDAVGPESMLVVIGRAMGPAVRGWCGAEDVWQETLALAWRDRDRHAWTDVASYRAWLVVIARNRIVDLSRRISAERRGGTRRTGLFSDIDGDSARGFEEFLPAGSTTPSRVASSRERSRVMEEALASLPEDEQAVVAMHLFEERPMEEIARELGLGVSAAWRRFRKGSAAYARRLAVLDSRASRG